MKKIIQFENKGCFQFMTARTDFIDPSDFIAQLSIDCVVFGYTQSRLHVLISKLNIADNLWALPGGFIGQNESIENAAVRILKERTSLDNIFLEQFKVFGQTDRVNTALKEALEHLKTLPEAKNPFPSDFLRWISQRFISIGFYALVDIQRVSPQKTSMDDSVDWYPIDELPEMIMDHNQMVLDGLEELRENLDEKLIGFNLLPETFTMKDLQELYETVYNRPFPRNNFQKKMLDLNILERLEKQFTGAQNRAPYVYKLKNRP